MTFETENESKPQRRATGGRIIIYLWRTTPATQGGVDGHARCADQTGGGLLTGKAVPCHYDLPCAGRKDEQDKRRSMFLRIEANQRAKKPSNGVGGGECSGAQLLV